MEPEAPERPLFLLRWAGVSLIAIGLLLPLVRARQLDGAEDIRLIGLTATRWTIGLLVLAILMPTLSEMLDFSPAVSRLAVRLAATALVLLMATTLVILESLASVLSPDKLPKTIERFSIGAESMAGMWALLAGGSTVVLSTSGCNRIASERLASIWSALRSRSTAATGVVAGSTAVVTLLVGRQAGWIDITTPAGAMLLQGNALPFIGPVTLVLVLLVAIAIGSAIVRPNQLIGGSLVLLGWLLTLPSAVILVLVRSSPTLTLPESLAGEVRPWLERLDALSETATLDLPMTNGPLELGIGAGRGVIAFYAAGLLVACAGLLLLWSARQETSSEWVNHLHDPDDSFSDSDFDWEQQL